MTQGHLAHGILWPLTFMHAGLGGWGGAVELMSHSVPFEKRF